MDDAHRPGAVMSAALGDLDLLDVQRAEREALNRPSPSALWDGRLYTTHGVTFSWPERGDDLIAESNYVSALRLIRLAAGDTADEDVIDATISDWLVGSLRQIFVRIRDERGAYTPAFCEAVRLALHAGDHVLIDEQDHRAREADARDALLADALWRAGSPFDTDSDTERDEVTRRTRAIIDDAGLYDSPDDIDPEQIAQRYRAERDRYFTTLAAARAYRYRAVLRPTDGHGWPGPGQLPLFND